MNPSALAILLLASCPALSAQTLRVKVVEEGSLQGLPGVMVTIQSEKGQPLLRRLADDFGLVRFVLPAPGRYRLLGGRIGYEPPLPRLISVNASDSALVLLAMPPARMSLPELTSTSSQRVVCRLGAESGNLMAALWDEVQKMLWGTELLRDAASGQFEMRTYERDLNRAGQVVAERAQVHPSTHDRPFVTEDPRTLSRDGFVRRDQNGLTYFAPDARLLLSDEFTQGHCFEVVPGPPSDPDLVGLAFRPIPSRRIADVAGTLWLDRRSAVLQSLDFTYVNVDLLGMGPTVGGRMEFHLVRGLGWVMDRWSVRVPSVAMLIGGDTRPGRPSARDSLIGFRESGGEAKYTGGAAPSAGSGLAIEGILFDSLRGVPLPGATVSVAGGSYRTETDSLGHFSLHPAAPGDYVVTFEHSRFGWLGMGAVQRAARTSRGAPTRLDIAIPPPERVLAALCPSMAMTDSSAGAIVGRLAPRPAGQATLEASWPPRAVVRSGFGVTIRRSGVSMRVAADEAGNYRLCGVPRDVDVVLRAAIGSQLVERQTIRLGSVRVLEQPFAATTHQ